MKKEHSATKKCKQCGMEIPSEAKICPHCRKKQKGGKLKWILIVIVVLAAVGAAAGGGNDSGENSKVSSKTDSVNTNQTKDGESIAATESMAESETEKAYIVCTVDQMMDDLDKNALKAASIYEDQYVEITGKLGTIDSSGDYISLMPDTDFAIIGVHCRITTEEQKNQVMEMSADDTVTLRGKCTDVGEVLGYTVEIESIE